MTGRPDPITPEEIVELQTMVLAELFLQAISKPPGALTQMIMGAVVDSIENGPDAWVEAMVELDGWCPRCEGDGYLEYDDTESVPLVNRWSPVDKKEACSLCHSYRGIAFDPNVQKELEGGE